MAAVMPRRIPGAPVCLCVLCGLPAAGKSTLSRKILGTVAECGWRAAVVSYDDLIQEQAYYTQMEEEHSNWKSHRQAVLQCIEQFLERPEVFGEMPSSPLINGSAWQKCVSTLLQPEGLNRDGMPLLLLLDDNFYYPSMRYEVYQLARKLFLGFCQVFLQCDLETCIRRNQSRPGPIPVKVIMEMEKRLESPNPQGNLWESQSILLDSTNDVTKCDIQRVIELISTALNNPLSPAEDNSEKKEADRLKCAKSVVHQADQACRRLISEAMQAAREHQVPPGDMRVLAARLNECKGTFLHDLRKHFLQEVVFLQEEDISVEQVVQRALRRDFHDKKDEILLNIMRNQKT
ncbi:PREDICTED: L-seryl-tRNA(Sec) kinase [Cyprinodon variegatus]|uniref:Phosphoseryl-tRNA kinase n=1 Tax=Cyprinodon variegatus TaxID=28743 RepID=A0A3Q2E9V1_CYPVA|nr:PREDICTED: L-seryl-tRNA(Sec) kinase [Cyprinodon variegatus]